MSSERNVLTFLSLLHKLFAAWNQLTGMSMEFSKSASHAALEIESQFPVYLACIIGCCRHVDKISDHQLRTTVTCLLPLARSLWYSLRMDLIFHSGLIIHTWFQLASSFFSICCLIWIKPFLKKKHIVTKSGRFSFIFSIPLFEFYSQEAYTVTTMLHDSMYFSARIMVEKILISVSDQTSSRSQN
jgi:hypothetical protein